MGHTEYTGLPEGVTQVDYESYVMDMEARMDYSPDEATLADMEREHLSAQETVKLQKQVFSASYIDSVMLDGRMGGDKSRSELLEIAAAGGTIGEGRGALFGARAQSAMSYYAIRRLDEINEEADKAGEDGFYVRRDGLKGMYVDYRRLDFELNHTQGANTSVLTEAAEKMLVQETGRPADMDRAMDGVYYPSDMRHMFGDGPWTEQKSMVAYVSDMVASGQKSGELAPYKAAILDRYCNMLPGALEDESDRRVLFAELAEACDAVQSPAAAGTFGDVIIRNEPESVTRALLGYTASKQADGMGFGEYLKQRGLGHDIERNEAAFENGREIKNAPEFDDNGEERSEDYGYQP